ncbi:hypothetical protein [Devosia sp.]|uniref:hypothetical protein n=1 Tax=Devosia sp. TaxID=1871048 RepID=UPI003263D18B
MTTPVVADGRADWQDYAWQTIAYSDCPAAATDALGLCPAYHQKWDWKRNQWVDIAFRFNPANGKFILSQTLTNNDRADDDDVCVTALFVDAKGHDLYVYHQNWHSLARDAMRQTLRATLRRSIFATATKVIIGSKQCRRGAQQDDDKFAAVKATIGQ